MNSSSCKLVTLLFVFCSVFFACSRNAGNTNAVVETPPGSERSTVKGPYPQAVADEFVKSCVAAGSDAAFCACMLKKVQDKYSFEEFSVIEAKIVAGSPPEEFVEFNGRARAECLNR